MAAKHPRKAEEVLNSLKRLKPELQARYYVKNIGLLGSVLRGEQKKAAMLISWLNSQSLSAFSNSLNLKNTSKLH